MTIKEINKLLMFGSSHNIPIVGFPMGVTRWQVFLAIKPILQGKKYWLALRSAYTMSDNLFHYKYDVKAAFLNNEPEMDFLMNETERNYLKQLPSKVIIYRGMTKLELEQKSFGCSWTLKEDVAKFFTKDYSRNIDVNHLDKVVHKMTIDKRKIIAFFNDRSEYEIIYL